MKHYKATPVLILGLGLDLSGATNLSDRLYFCFILAKLCFKM